VTWTLAFGNTAPPASNTAPLKLPRTALFCCANEGSTKSSNIAARAWNILSRCFIENSSKDRLGLVGF
jgi:hypothetical protein